MARKQAGVYQSEPGWVRVVFPYDPSAIVQIKAITGRGNYKYDSVEKLWRVLEPYAELIIAMLERLGYEVQTDIFPSSQASSADNPFGALFAAAPSSYHQALYRALAKVVHPDTGGLNSLMSELNGAYKGASR